MSKIKRFIQFNLKSECMVIGAVLTMGNGLSLRGDGREVADVIDEGAEDGESVGMLLAVGLGSIAVLRLPGGDEQSHKHISLEGTVRCCGMGCEGLQEVGAQPLFETGLIAVYQQTLVQKRRTDKHEGRETSPVVIAVNLYSPIGQQTVQAWQVMAALLGRAFATMAAQELHHLFLDIPDEVTGEQLFRIMVGKDDIALMEVVEIDTPGLSQDVDGHPHGDAVGMEADTFYLALTALPFVNEQCDTVTNCHLADRFDRQTEEYLQLAIHQYALELLQLAIGNDDGVSLLVTIVVEMQS